MNSAPLGELLVKVQSGFACGEQDPNGIFQFRMHNISKDGGLAVDSRRRIPVGAHRRVEQFELFPGDVLFNATNSPDNVGKSALIRDLDEFTVFSNHFLRLRPDPGWLDSAYLWRWMQSEYQRGLFRGMCRQWVNQATVDRESLLSLRIPLPNVEEQRRIAGILDRADAIRAKRRQVLAHIDTLIQAVFHDMFGDPLDCTPGATVEPLRAWIDPDRPITYGILKPGPDQEGGVPYVRVADMKNRGIDLRGIRRTSSKVASEYRRSTLQAGDLIMSIRGHVGRFASVPPELSGANITQDSARLAVEDPNAAAYVRAAMESPNVQHWMARRTKGAAVKGINLGDLRELPLPVPPSERQRLFATRVDRVDAQRALVHRALDADNELFASLQARAFQGEL